MTAAALLSVLALVPARHRMRWVQRRQSLSTRRPPPTTADLNTHWVEEGGGREAPPTACDQYLKLAGFKDAVYETRLFYREVAWSKANKTNIWWPLSP